MAKTGRPKKDKRLLMNVALRIMVTAEQREQLGEAAKLGSEEVSAWARRVLLHEAAKLLDGTKPKSRQK
jgi:hypothetical protein